MHEHNYKKYDIPGATKDKKTVSIRMENKDERGRLPADPKNKSPRNEDIASTSFLLLENSGMEKKCEMSPDYPLQDGGPNIYRIQGIQGRVLIIEYNIFHGIWVCYKEAHALAFENLTGYPNALLEITYCREGRLEYEGEDRYFYLGEGDMSIHKSSGNRAVLHCPTGHYHGISIVIDPETAPQCTSCLLSDVNVDLPSLFQKFCSQDRYFIMRSAPRLAHLFSDLYAVPEAVKKGYLKVKVLELLIFLSYLDSNQSRVEQCTCTKAQAQLLKQVFLFIRTHPNTHLTAEALAKQFHVSPKQLRYNAKSVYGMPLYQCIRTYKMHLAAVQLLCSSRTVMDIANEFGYDNSSKFANAFQSVMGKSPTEYRMDATAADKLPSYFKQQMAKSERKKDDLE